MPQALGDFAVGDLVQLKSTASANGKQSTGMLMKHLGAGRWSVIMDDNGGNSQVVNAKDLQKVCPPPRTYSIVGSWDDWTVHAMTWDSELWCFEYDVLDTKIGAASFKVLLEGRWESCIYPDRLDALPGDGHRIRGPDDGSSEEWTIGEWTLAPLGDGLPAEGDSYKVRFFILDDGSPKSVSWELLPKERTIPSYHITGSWDDWESHETTWNDALGCCEYRLVLAGSAGSEGMGHESFRFLLDGDWEKCVYPDRAEAFQDDGHRILGPDDGGSLGEWSLRGRSGSRWQIRLFLKESGRPLRVDWQFQREERAPRAAAVDDQVATPPTAPAPLAPESDEREAAQGTPAKELSSEATAFEKLLAEVCPRWTSSARSQLAGMGIQDVDDLRDAVHGPLNKWCRVTLGEKAVAVLCARLDA